MMSEIKKALHELKKATPEMIYLFDVVSSMIDFIGKLEKNNNLPPHVALHFSIFGSFESADIKKKYELSERLVEKLDMHIILDKLYGAKPSYTELMDELKTAIVAARCSLI